MVAGQDMVVHSRCFDRKLPYKELLEPLLSDAPNYDLDYEMIKTSLPICTPLVLKAFNASHGHSSTELNDLLLTVPEKQ
jgi:hypothetical protein